MMMRFQADILPARVDRPANIETTALGAAYLAGLAVGVYETKDEIAGNRHSDRVFEPAMDAKERSALYGGWEKAVKRTLGWESGGIQL